MNVPEERPRLNAPAAQVWHVVAPSGIRRDIWSLRTACRRTLRRTLNPNGGPGGVESPAFGSRPRTNPALRRDPADQPWNRLSSDCGAWFAIESDCVPNC